MSPNLAQNNVSYETNENSPSEMGSSYRKYKAPGPSRRKITKNEKECENCGMKSSKMTFRRDRNDRRVCNACGLYSKLKECDRPAALWNKPVTTRKSKKSKKNQKETNKVPNDPQVRTLPSNTPVMTSTCIDPQLPKVFPKSHSSYNNAINTSNPTVFYHHNNFSQSPAGSFHQQSSSSQYQTIEVSPICVNPTLELPSCESLKYQLYSTNQPASASTHLVDDLSSSSTSQQSASFSNFGFETFSNGHDTTSSYQTYGNCPFPYYQQANSYPIHDEGFQMKNQQPYQIAGVQGQTETEMLPCHSNDDYYIIDSIFDPSKPWNPNEVEDSIQVRGQLTSSQDCSSVYTEL